MTELIAALLGALVGGAVSAWASATQTAKVLKYEVELAADGRREAERQEAERRITSAADHLLTELANFTTVDSDEPDRLGLFVRVTTGRAVHAERRRRVTELTRAGAAHAHMLPEEVRRRWAALMWWVRYADSQQKDRKDTLRQRDLNDLLMYAEYVRRTLVGVTGLGDSQPDYPPPDPRRDSPRPWGHSPESGSEEPDLTGWFMSARLVGQVKFETGELRWYGPDNQVETLQSESQPNEDDEG